MYALYILHIYTYFYEKNYFLKKVKVYDEETKTIVLDFDRGDWNMPGHSNRVIGKNES